MVEGLGQRQLAAIVFTDVAGFSAKASADEERVLRRVKEDLDLLTGLAGNYHGKVVKTTGDGLLISFASAVDAVSFAIEGQRRITSRNESLPPPTTASSTGWASISATSSSRNPTPWEME